MKKLFITLFVALLMVGCGEEDVWHSDDEGFVSPEVSEDDVAAFNLAWEQIGDDVSWQVSLRNDSKRDIGKMDVEVWVEVICRNGDVKGDLATSSGSIGVGKQSHVEGWLDFLDSPCKSIAITGVALSYWDGRRSQTEPQSNFSRQPIYE